MKGLEREKEIINKENKEKKQMLKVIEKELISGLSKRGNRFKKF